MWSYINICRVLEVPLVGIFCRDELPKACVAGNYVFNLAKSGEPGTHWVCAIVRKKIMYYFDSYGMRMFPELCKFSNCKVNYYNGTQLQSNTSVDCGWYVIAFLHFFSTRDIDRLDKFKEKFYQGRYLERNDTVLREYIEAYL